MEKNNQTSPKGLVGIVVLLMNKIILPNKCRRLYGLYGLLVSRLVEAQDSIKGASKKSFIPYEIVFSKICRNFSMEKEFAYECLFLLRDMGIIDIVKFKGIKLNYDFHIKDG